jgi:hypothetical protein
LAGLFFWRVHSSESRKFREVARTTGCDEDEAAFEKRLRKIAKAPAPKDASSKGAEPKRTK